MNLNTGLFLCLLSQCLLATPNSSFATETSAAHARQIGKKQALQPTKAKSQMSTAKKKQVDDDELIARQHQLTQMWAMAKNYAYGVTVAKDPVKALAWQQLYVHHLPASYPHTSRLLQPFKHALTKEQITDARHIEQWLKKKYALCFQFDEASLSRLFVLTHPKSTAATKQSQRVVDTGLIGLIKPQWASAEAFVSLHKTGNGNIDEPWLVPLATVTTLANGQFYQTGLAPGDYELVIANKKQVIRKLIHLSKGQVLNLGTYHLQQS